MSSKSKIDALKAYYSSGPTGETSDYLEPTKKKKTKKKAKIANVSGMKIVDVDTETKVKEPERKDDSDEGMRFLQLFCLFFAFGSGIFLERFVGRLGISLLN
jgi:hypothetical protein